LSRKFPGGRPCGRTPFFTQFPRQLCRR